MDKKLKLLLCIITTILLSISTICNGASQTNTKQQQSITYEYYGIINGNGTQCNIYLKVNNNWEQYTISSNYKGYACKLIVIDSILNTKTYKDITIINITDSDNFLLYLNQILRA